MNRPPLTRTAVWVRERACVPLVKVEAGGATAPGVTAPVAELAAARRQPSRRTRRRAA
ncbi:hypothetical protein ACFRFH_07875 [Leifsonia sp. NPDC056824]|uniref:hypothetical protein n=1 Tax=Leifsonia sp. NPDC056824 TaxID=3345953 RepID=UPI003674C324